MVLQRMIDHTPITLICGGFCLPVPQFFPSLSYASVGRSVVYEGLREIAVLTT
jgi:hypothetical protein